MRCAALALAVTLLGLGGCGPYRIKYQLPSRMALHQRTHTVSRLHSHGMGIGGGGYFFVVQNLFPALVDYTGEVNTRAVCPYGFTEVEHYHAFWQSTVAAVISWFGALNFWHPSWEVWTCVTPEWPPPGASPPPPPPTEPSPPASEPPEDTQDSAPLTN